MRHPGVVVATPVLERLRASGGVGTLLARTGSGAYVGVGNFVVALTDAPRPVLPNGMAGLRLPGNGCPPGTQIRLLRGEQAIETWDPAVTVFADGGEVAARRASEMLRRLAVGLGALPERAAARVSDRGREACRSGLCLLMTAVGERNAALARLAAEKLLGHGPGLTPFGDDLLCAAAIAVAALAPAFGWRDASREWLAALLAPAPRLRTTALSATLLELAVAGNAIEPVHALLGVAAEDPLGWRRALRRLLEVGHSTGHAYALGLASAAAGMAATHVPPNRHRMRDAGCP